MPNTSGDLAPLQEEVIYVSFFGEMEEQNVQHFRNFQISNFPPEGERSSRAVRKPRPPSIVACTGLSFDTTLCARICWPIRGS